MGSRQQRTRRGGIPIPSFTISEVPVSPVKTMRAAPWNPQIIKQVVAALQIRRITKSIKVADFYQAVQHVTVTDHDSTHATEHCLGKGERLLLELLCATSPNLHKWGEKEGTLEVVHFTGNRLVELQRLLSEPQMLITKYDQCLKQVLGHRASINYPLPMITSTEEKPVQHEKLSMMPQLRPDMSLEERVRARAAAREERQLDASASTSSSVDQSAMLRLADALWSHSRHILLRQSQIQAMSPVRRGNTAPKACVMTVKDIVTTFASSFAPSQESTTHVSRTEKATRKQIIEAVQELHRLAPDWISCSDTELTKSTTIWIKPVNYQTIRAKLGAPTKVPDQLQTPVPCKRSLDVDKAVVTHSAGPKRASSPILPAKRQRLEVKAPLLSPVDSSPASRHTVLRINPNLILTDADYDGGMVIQPSEESPRGLKRMFTHMNAGRRI